MREVFLSILMFVLCSAKAQIEVTFQLDLSVVSDTSSVPVAGFISGSFNGFAIEPMVDEGDDIYSFSATFSEGEFVEFFYLSGSSFADKEPVPGDDCGNGTDRFLTVPESDTTVAVSFGGCNAPNTVKVVFELNLALVADTSIVEVSGFISGSFTDFSIQPMVNVGQDIYQFTTFLNEGEFVKYFFLSGNSFANKEPIPSSDCGDGQDRILTIGEETSVFGNVFGSCQPSNLVLVDFELDLSVVSDTSLVPVAGFISGSFNGFTIEPMIDEGNDIYSFPIFLEPGESLKYFYLSANSFDAKEPIPSSDCGDGVDRVLTVPFENTNIQSLFGSCLSQAPESIVFSSLSGNFTSFGYMLSWEVAASQRSATGMFEIRNLVNNNFVLSGQVSKSIGQTSFNFVSNEEPESRAFQIAFIDENGFETISDIFSLAIGTNSFTLFPNPAKDEVFFRGLTGSLKTVTITDLGGAIVLNSDFNEGSTIPVINISRLKAGNYILNAQLETPGGLEMISTILIVE